jgi:hypothetical protein
MLSGVSSNAFASPAPGATRPLGPLNEVLRNERSPADVQEARAALLELARRKSGHLPAEWLVAQALRVSDGTDWAAQRAALEALLRRIGFASRDALSIEKRPARGALWGRYVLAGQRQKPSGRRHGSERRPYDVDVYGLEPLAASCNCADFLRSSLGLCKHLLVALEDIAQQRRTAQRFDPAGLPPAARPELRWDPVRAWTGPGDRLEGLRWSAGAIAAPARGSGRGASARAQRAAAAALGAGSARPGALEDRAARGALVQLLLERYEAQPARAEPAALALLREERDQLARLSAGAAAAVEALPHLKSLRRRLYPYQLEGVQRFLERQRLLLADDMGLGKTTQAIAACHALYCAGRVERGLLIVPAPLRDQWQREWQATTERVPLAVVEGRAEERTRRFEQTKRGFLVMSYEQLLRDLGAVRRFAPSLIVLDEAQRIKNWTTKSSAYVTSLDPEWRLVLTGTPLENRLEELATLLDWVDDGALAPKWRLGPWHTSWASASSERTGARHLDTLRERLAPCLLRRVRREVLSQLPPRSDVRVPVEMSAPQREEHDARVPAIARLVQSARRRPLRQPEFLALMQLLAQQRIVSNGLALLRFDEVWPVYSAARADEALLVSSASPKLAEFRRVLRQLVLEQRRKVVVFSQWRKMLRLAEWAVRDLLDDAGLSSVFFTGEESQRARSANVVAFHEQPGVCVMFLSDAGGVGLNLQHAANACINLELPWNPAVLEQRIGRIYRLGQKDPIDVINLVCEYGIEARIAGLVGNKHALFSGLFDGTTDTVRFEGPASFIGDIERLLEPIEVPELEARDDSLEGAPDPELEPIVEATAAPPIVSEPVARDSEEPPASGAALPPAPGVPDIAHLFASIAVSSTPEGGLRIEAPAAAAATLSQLLSGFAQLLQAAAPPRR